MTHLGPGVEDRAVLHHQRVGVERISPQGGENEGRPVEVLPVENSPDAVTVDIGGVVLGPDEAVLHQSVVEGVDAVPVGSPGEDLDPFDDGWLVLVVSGRHVDRVIGGVSNGNPFDLGVGGS